MIQIDGSAYYGTLLVSEYISFENFDPYHYFQTPREVTWQTGEDVTLRSQFVNNGVLLNTQDTQFRGVSDKWPVFALAQELGQISTASDPVVFAVGHARDPAVEYIIAGNQTQSRSLYFWSQYNTGSDAVSLEPNIGLCCFIQVVGVAFGFPSGLS